jgi:hypothetical protein
MSSGRWLGSWWFRAPVILLFLALGVYLTALSAWIGPSFWYLPCALLLILGSVLWFRPKLGASFSLPILLAFAFQLGVTDRHGWKSLDPWLVCFACSIAVGFIFVIAVLRHSGFSIQVASCAIILIASAFAVDRKFTGQVKVQTQLMEWSVNGDVPWDVSLWRRTGIFLLLFLSD